MANFREFLEKTQYLMNTLYVQHRALVESFFMSEETTLIDLSIRLGRFQIRSLRVDQYTIHLR